MSTPYQRENMAKPTKKWKSLAKFSKAVKKISNWMPISPPSSENSTTAYSPKLSLYHCSCEYHDRQRKELNNRLSKTSHESNFSHQQPETVMHGDVHAKKRFQRSKTDHFPISDGDDNNDGDYEEEGGDNEGKDVNETNKFGLVEALDCASARPQMQQLQGVNQKAEEFIQKFWEGQRIQRQQSIEEFYAMLARGT